MSYTKKTSQNISAAIRMTVKTSGSYASKAKNLSRPLVKRVVLPPFVKQRNFKDRTGTYTIWIVDGNSERDRKIRPEFNSIPDLLSYLERYHSDIEFIVCPHSLKKGYETIIPTLPGTLYQHLKNHHKDVLKKLGVDPNSYSPVIWSHQKKDYSTPALERKNSKTKRKYSSKRKSKVKITQKDINAWPELGSTPKTKVKARNNANRKKIIDLRDKDGNEIESISTSNRFSVLD